MRYEKPEMVVKVWGDGDVFTDVSISGSGSGDKIEGSNNGVNWNN